jgi:serine/threonine protein kinase
MNEFVLNKNNVIGRGAFSQVYKTSLVLNGRERTVAVKVLCRQLYHQQTKEDLQLLMLIDHESIIRTLDVYTYDGRLALVLEHADCGTLYNALHVHPTIDHTVGLRLYWLQQTASALCYLHDMKPMIMVHGNLKPQHILLSHRQTRARLTIQYSTLNSGPLLWMAPESFGSVANTVASDVYSFGVIVWETITGRLPFSQDDGVLLQDLPAYVSNPMLWYFERVIESSLRPTPIPQDPIGINSIIEQMWSDEPNKRPSAIDVYNNIAMIQDVYHNCD